MARKAPYCFNRADTLMEILLFGMLISYRWGDAWTPPLPEVAVILLIVVSSVILAVHGPIKRIRNMSIVDTISAQ